MALYRPLKTHYQLIIICFVKYIFLLTLRVTFKKCITFMNFYQCIQPNRILQVILDSMKLFTTQINYLRIENDKMLICIGKSMSYGAKSLNTTIFYPSL